MPDWPPPSEPPQGRRNNARSFGSSRLPRPRSSTMFSFLTSTTIESIVTRSTRILDALMDSFARDATKLSQSRTFSKLNYSPITTQRSSACFNLCRSAWTARDRRNNSINFLRKFRFYSYQSRRMKNGIVFSSLNQELARRSRNRGRAHRAGTDRANRLPFRAALK
jgi:hypothetical protein